SHSRYTNLGQQTLQRHCLVAALGGVWNPFHPIDWESLSVAPPCFLVGSLCIRSSPVSSEVARRFGAGTRGPPPPRTPDSFRDLPTLDEGIGRQLLFSAFARRARALEGVVAVRLDLSEGCHRGFDSAATSCTARVLAAAPFGVSSAGSGEGGRKRELGDR